MTWEIREGDVLDRLREIPDESVQCAVTSPPYFGLRDYGVDGQIGLEATLDEYLDNLVAVFAEVRRVLRSDGTLWLNIGDSYASRPRAEDGSWDPKQQGRRLKRSRVSAMTVRAKPKDLMMIPAQLALALRTDGWWLRSEIIWSKPAPLPESITDRPSRSHEQVYLLSKAQRYFYDAEAIREPDVGHDHPRQVLDGQPSLEPSNGLKPPHRGLRTPAGRDGLGRNKRSVWTIHSGSYPDAHFATFPPALVEPCIRAGTAEQACVVCSAPWRRRVDVEYVNPGNRTTNGPRSIERRHREHGSAGYEKRLERRTTTTGFEPTCDHPEGGGSSMVLDPFAGAGTTLLVAERLGRDSIGIELNADYCELARRRIRDDSPLLNTAAEAAA